MPRDPRAIVLVLDSVGAGELPDAALYGDEGSNTLANTAAAAGGLSMPNLGAMGLGNITTILGVPPTDDADGLVGQERRALRGQGHHDRPLGDGRHGARAAVSHLSRRLPARGDGRVHRARPASGGSATTLRAGPRSSRNSAPSTSRPASPSSTRAATASSRSRRTRTSSRSRSCTASARSSRDQVVVGEHAVGRVIARPFIGPNADGRVHAHSPPS